MGMPTIETFQATLKISLVVFMVGNLLAMGLELSLREALTALRHLRFLALSVAWGFALCPALARLLARVLPMDPSYAAGLVLMGMTPCAPFMPMMVRRARGDMAYAAALMPFAVPLMAVGDADPRATIMIVLGVPITVAMSALSALWFAKRAVERGGSGRSLSGYITDRTSQDVSGGDSRLSRRVP
jgi:predicted Na+-dependent transporter